MNPSPWVVQSLERMGLQDMTGLCALDLACGAGRHSLYLAERGFDVLAVDKSVPDGLASHQKIRFEQMDLEGQQWPLAGQTFDLIVATNYLYRPYWNHLLACLNPSGVLIYETFMRGNEQFGSPRNPDFLLCPGELLERCSGLQILGFEQGLRLNPSEAMIQRITAVLGDWTEIQSQSKLK
jgi:SAM-dependent methyltransferase